MNEYYIKRGKKYIPVGVHNLKDNIPYGIWYVRKHPYGTSRTSIDFWETNQFLDIKKTCSQIELTDIIVDAVRSMDEKNFSIYNISYYDFAKELAKKILK